MNNFLAYFYNINVDKIKFKKDYYYFMYNGYLYRLYILDKNTNINFLISLNQQLLNITLISEIIMNKDLFEVLLYPNPHRPNIHNDDERAVEGDEEYWKETGHVGSSFCWTRGKGKLMVNSHELVGNCNTLSG